MEATLPGVSAETSSIAETLEKIANGHTAHERFVFEQGYNRAHQEVEEAVKAEIKKTQDAAVAFLGEVRRAIPGFTTFKQMRVGWNSMQELTVFAVLDGGTFSTLETARTCARMVEEAVWDNSELMLSIWTVSDGSLDQAAIDNDFPWLYIEE